MGSVGAADPGMPWRAAGLERHFHARTEPERDRKGLGLWGDITGALGVT